MYDPAPQKLSGLIDGESDILKPSTRRRFLTNASTLSLAIPGVGVALAACSAGDDAKPDTTAAVGSAAPRADHEDDDRRHHNSDSKLDTSLFKGRRGGNTSITRATPENEIAFRRFDPTLPPLMEGGVKLS